MDLLASDLSAITSDVNSPKYVGTLTEKLKQTIVQLLTDHPDHETVILDDDANSQKLCYLLELVLQHGLKERLLFGTIVFWQVVERLNECLPNINYLLNMVRDCSKNNTARGRIFIRASLNDGTFTDLITGLIWNSELLKSFYKDNALLRNEESINILLMLFEQLKGVKFSLFYKDNDLEKANYWEKIFKPESPYKVTVSQLQTASQIQVASSQPQPISSSSQINFSQVQSGSQTNSQPNSDQQLSPSNNSTLLTIGNNSLTESSIQLASLPSPSTSLTDTTAPNNSAPDEIEKLKPASSGSVPMEDFEGEDEIVAESVNRTNKSKQKRKKPNRSKIASIRDAEMAESNQQNDSGNKDLSPTGSDSTDKKDIEEQKEFGDNSRFSKPSDEPVNKLNQETFVSTSIPSDSINQRDAGKFTFDQSTVDNKEKATDLVEQVAAIVLDSETKQDLPKTVDSLEEILSNLVRIPKQETSLFKDPVLEESKQIQQNTEPDQTAFATTNGDVQINLEDLQFDEIEDKEFNIDRYNSTGSPNKSRANTISMASVNNNSTADKSRSLSLYSIQARADELPTWSETVALKESQIYKNSFRIIEDYDSAKRSLMSALSKSISNDSENSSVYRVQEPMQTIKSMARSFQYILRIPPKIGLNKYNNYCAGCGILLQKKTVFSKGLFSTALNCHYTGKYYCNDCHHGDKSVIPARVVQNCDKRAYPVCIESYGIILSNYNMPMIDLSLVNPTLYEWDNSLESVRNLRVQLGLLGEFIRTCRSSGKLIDMLDDRQYLLTSAHLYSLRDLVDTKQLLTFCTDINEKYTYHITQTCDTCQGKGFYCEICRSKELVFTFQLKQVAKCPTCKALFHKKCVPSLGSSGAFDCPKCQRIKKIKQK